MVISSTASPVWGSVDAKTATHNTTSIDLNKGFIKVFLLKYSLSYNNRYMNNN
jgi:hypothetical protein